MHIRARYAHGQGVAAYLARYLRGGPLKNTQLLPAVSGAVRFRYQPHRDEDDGAAHPIVMRLEPEAFLSRYLQHLPPPRLQTARSYGLYGPRSGTRLDQARAALGEPPVIEPAPLTLEAFLARFDRTPAAATCVRCGARLTFVPLIHHGPAPPDAPH